MQMDTITELLSIPNYKVPHMVNNSETRMDFVLARIKDVSPVYTGCCRVHDTPIHSFGSIAVEDLPISGKKVFLHEDERIRKQESDFFRSLSRYFFYFGLNGPHTITGFHSLRLRRSFCLLSGSACKAFRKSQCHA